jgi:DNA-binding response OmpR family regulator
MQAKILLIDDDAALLKLLGQYLEQAGYKVSRATDGRQGLQTLYNERPDLVILDVMMPRLDGWTVCERIRDLSDVPIIMLTAKGEEMDKLRGFRLGVDDYITKPFSFAELTARVDAILSRVQRSSGRRDAHVYHCGQLTIDFESHTVLRAEEVISLTPTEFRLLRCLAQNAGRVLSPESLLREVWGPQYIDETGYIRRYIWYLRQKIEPDPSHPEYILTEREFGYRFRKD